nr:nodulation protein [Melilotus officinalis]
MANQLSRSYTYDVFISFRGEDTRNGFTGYLWKALKDKGIHTFIHDDQEISKGEQITPSLMKAIEESRIAIIVLSQNYASSFCLDVLVHIVYNFQHSNTPQLILPVFYCIDPSDVGQHHGSYGEAMARYEKRFQNNQDHERLQKWKMALTQVTNLSGWNFNGDGDGYEFQFIDKIVEEVSKKIDRVPLHIADYTVGLVPRLEEVCPLLELESPEVLVVGIYGVGGIGKTTLARALYNMIEHQFEASCFLSNVRESSNRHGLVHLQNMLLSNMLGLKINLGDASEGVSLIKQRLHRKKVLLILDDVDALEQLEGLVGGLDWFGSGSRVIVTTRDRHLLAFHRVEITYEIQELNRVDALELLSHKVFKQGIVDPNYTELLNRVVNYASGLPLALEVIGSSLFGKSVDQWKHALDRFERIPPNDIQSTLRVSFDALDQEEKNIFLDITCCFKGYELADVEDILRARYGHDLKYHIGVLIDKCLLNISSDGKVTPHPLIESMGKEIVREESPKDPGRRSRLWFPEDIVQVLKNNKGSSNIEIIHLDSPLIEYEKEIRWDGEAFKKMPNLKILIIRKCHFSKAPKYLPNSLKVLEWWNYPSEKLPSDFDSKQLVICRLPKLTELLKISHVSPEVSQTSNSGPEVLHTVRKASQIMLQISHRVFQAKTTWRLVGLVSSVVGLFCYALSPSFNRLIGRWKTLQYFLYGVLSFAIVTAILFAEKSSLSTRHVQLKTYTSFLVLMIISVYSFFYDRAVNGKPEILSIVSNAAFALVSLSLHKLINFGFEIGVFSYFLGCFTVQLLTINWKLIFVAVFFGCPLYVMHSSRNSRLELASGGEVIGDQQC